MPALNEMIAGRLDEVARLLAEQGANRFRVEAYRRAATMLRSLRRPVSEIFAQKGLPGLQEIPGVGISIAYAIRDMLRHGKLAMLERLRGDTNPIALLTSVPGLGKTLAWKLYTELDIATLEELELAAGAGRLQDKLGLGAKRLAGIRDSLAHRLSGIPSQQRGSVTELEVPVSELLDVDAEYRRGVAAGSLKRIAPRRFNPSAEAWLPVLHTSRGPRHYTALCSNTARAHQLHKEHDWVVLYWDGDWRERQCTIVTSGFGPLKGLRIVRGRETECVEHYRRHGDFGTPTQLALLETAA